MKGVFFVAIAEWAQQVDSGENRHLLQSQDKSSAAQRKQAQVRQSQINTSHGGSICQGQPLNDLRQEMSHTVPSVKLITWRMCAEGEPSGWGWSVST